MTRLKVTALAACLVASVHVGPAPLRPLCLQPRDVPKGFVEITSGPFTNSDLSKLVQIPPKVLADQLGRVGGYETQFKRSVPGQLHHISDAVSSFRSAKGAQNFDALNVRAARAATPYGAHLKALPGPRIGHYARAFSIAATYQGRPYRSIVIYFHRGSLSADVSAEAYGGGLTLAQVTALARVIDARFKARCHC